MAPDPLIVISVPFLLSTFPAQSSHFKGKKKLVTEVWGKQRRKGTMSHMFRPGVLCNRER